MTGLTLVLSLSSVLKRNTSNSLFSVIVCFSRHHSFHLIPSHVPTSLSLLCLYTIRRIPSLPTYLLVPTSERMDYWPCFCPNTLCIWSCCFVTPLSIIESLSPFDVYLLLPSILLPLISCRLSVAPLPFSSQQLLASCVQKLWWLCVSFTCRCYHITIYHLICLTSLIVCCFLFFFLPFSCDSFDPPRAVVFTYR